MERLEGWAFDSCEILGDLETSKGVKILLDHLRWHFAPIDVFRHGKVADDFISDFERQPDEEVDVLEAKEASDDELEAKHQGELQGNAPVHTTSHDLRQNGGERGEVIPSWDGIDAWWEAGLLYPIEGETEGSSHVGRWSQQKAANWEQVPEEINSFSVKTCSGRGARLPGSCVDPSNGYSCSCSPSYLQQAERWRAIGDRQRLSRASTIKLEDTITYKGHEECSLDDTVDGDPSFMTTSGALPIRQWQSLPFWTVVKRRVVRRRRATSLLLPRFTAYLRRQEDCSRML